MPFHLPKFHLPKISTVKDASKEVAENAKTFKRKVIVLIAGILLIFSVIGSFIPLFPAKTVAAPSLILLSMYSPTVYAYMKRKSQNYPRIQSILDRIRNWTIHKLH